jgi:Eukaryotic cytochrome b561
MTGYHGLIRAHGILAAITFLGLVPAAIMFARFYGRSPFWALRLHIWLQILTFLLTTVLFILGFFAVGPARNLSNPHHGIGVAIYVLIIVQVFGGWMIHGKEKGKRRLHIPLKLMLHQWFGRMIALLGVVQIPLGLSLYGSPQYLFILYTLAAFVLLITYFVLSWLHQRRLNRDYDAGGSYHAGHDDVIDDGRDDRRSRLGKLAVAGLGAAGLAALWRRRSKNRRDDDDVVGTESGTSYITNEKYSETSGGGWRSKLLTIGVVAASIAAVRALFGGRQDDTSDVGPYRPPLGGNQSVVTESYIEEGRRPSRPITPTGASPGYIRPSHPLAQPPMTPHHRHSHSSLTYSYSSGSPSRRDRRHNFRNAAATGGAIFALRQMFKGRRQRKEDRRLEEERVQRANSHGQYTGDGFSPRRHRPHRMGSQSSTDFSGSLVDDRHHRPGGVATGPILGGVGAASAAALADRDRVRPPGTDPLVTAGPSTLPADIPPIPPIHRTDVDTSGSEVYATTSGHPHHRHHLRDEAAGAAIGGAAGSRRRHSGRVQNTDSMESPPVSLKVKMHNDGRHVTLRRLTEEEAAAQREERRRAKRASVPAAAAAGGAAGIANSGRRRRNSSFSSSSGGEGPSGHMSNADRRWRRTEALERQQAEAMAAQNAASAAAAAPPISAYQPSVPPQAQPQYTTTIDPRTGQQLNVPPPPPIPTGSGLGPPGSVTSPGTETSGATEYANNRRRRRAERAQARLAREGRLGGGQSVEFS